MANYKIKHITRYTYSQPVIDSVNQVMLYPLHDAGQSVLHHTLHISGDPQVETFTDYFGNRLGVFTLHQPHAFLTITSDIEVETHEVPLPSGDRSAVAEWQALEALRSDTIFMDYLRAESFSQLDEVTNLVKGMLRREETPLQNAQRLSEYIYTHFQYRKGITSVETGMEDIWRLKAGVCQDFAHILLVMLHIAGIPARYVSGYICPTNGELRGEGATHAWVETHIPFYGWLGLDPTNNCIARDKHVRLATGRHFSDCTPVKGTYKGSAEHRLEVSVVITTDSDEAPGNQGTEPVFSYRVDVPASPVNSYRQFMEAQQQQ
jgi:transglutaminase-like putative cysteine protease